MAETSILITGGAGFIGSRLARRLRERDPAVRVCVLDNLHPQVHGPAAQAPAPEPGVTFLRGDVADRAAVLHAVTTSRPAIVYHLAAETGTGQSYDEPTRYCAANVLGTTHLVEALRAVPGTRRVVLAGSRAVYGEGAYVDASGATVAALPRSSERMAAGHFEPPLPGGRGPGRPAASRAGLPVAPASVYASTKLMQELLLQQAGEGAAWSAVVLRLQNVYGAGQSLRNPYTGVLSIFARQLLEGRTLDIYEDGRIARDFVYVDDVVEALAVAGEAAVPHGTVVDIGSGRAETILEVARLLMRELGRPDDAYRITGNFRPGDVRHACADVGAARQLLGWEPGITTADGMARLARWAAAEHAQLLQEEPHP